jgi:hypothetical protein
VGEIVRVVEPDHQHRETCYECKDDVHPIKITFGMIFAATGTGPELARIRAIAGKARKIERMRQMDVPIQHVYRFRTCITIRNRIIDGSNDDRCK